MKRYLTTLFCLLLFITGFVAIVFLLPGPTEAQQKMDMRMSMGGAAAVATYENYQVKDNGGWENYQVKDNGGWENYQVRQ